jgi:hypothetical protein
VSDDWLQHGHETEGVELVPVLSTSSVLDDRAGAPSRPRWTSGWRGVMAGGTIALFATLGVVGVANAISDNLFPSMGPTSPASVWQNPVPAREPATTSAMTVPSTTVPSTTAPAPASTIPATAPSPTTSAPRNAVDREDGDVVVTTTDAADDEPDDRIDDNSGSSSGSGSGRDDSDDSDDSDSSGSSGSGKSGSDDSRDSDDD